MFMEIEPEMSAPRATTFGFSFWFSSSPKPTLVDFISTFIFSCAFHQ
ncbi:Uncharacterised protein [uncultured archaeon]|nr:Uncharacterised protein [uncultured archaeon]